MFIALGFLRTLHAEGGMFQAKLFCERAGWTDTCFLLGNTHETLSDQAENTLFCILGTGSVGWTHHAMTHAFVFLHILVQFCRRCSFYILHHLFKFIHCFSPLPSRSTITSLLTIDMPYF